MADVFISYRSESALRLVEDTLVPAIESAGFPCWYAKRDSHSGAYGGNIKRAIYDCRVFLLVLEQAALHSPHIRNETALAFRRLADDEPITLIPFRIDDCNLRDDDDLDYYLLCEQIVDGRPPDAAHIQNLLDIISELLAEPLP